MGWERMWIWDMHGAVRHLAMGLPGGALALVEIFWVETLLAELPEEIE
jgi:hypothetical protein